MEEMKKEEKKVGCEGVGVARACGCKFLQDDGGCSFAGYCKHKSPEEKKEEWVDVTEKVKLSFSYTGNSYWIHLDYEEQNLAFLGYSELEEMFDADGFKLEKHLDAFRILKKT